MFNISQEGIDLIKRFEGLRLEAYYDVAGIITIGYGHTGSDVYEGQVISEDEAERLLRKDLQRFEDSVNAAVKAPIVQAMFDALVSLSFNIGSNAFKKSTALKRLNKEDYQGAAEAITWWNKATVNGEKVVVSGLARRRAAESALFLRDLDQLTDEPDTTGIKVEENTPRRNNPITSRTTTGAAASGTAGAAGAGAVLLDENEEKEDGSESGESTDTESTDTDTGDSDAGDTDTGDADSADTDGSTDSDSSDAGDADATDEDAADADSDTDAGETDGTDTSTEVPTDQPNEIGKTDYTEAFIVAMGVLAVLAAIYVISARIDDWRNYRR